MSNQELIEVIERLTQAMEKANKKESKKSSGDGGGGGGDGGIGYDPTTEEGLRRQREMRLANLELQIEEQRLMGDMPALYASVKAAEDELAAAIKKRDQAGNDLDAQAKANLDNQIESLQKMVDKNQELVQGYDKLSAAQKRARKASDQFFSSSLKFFGLGGDFMNTYVGKFLKFTQIIAKGGPVQFFKSMGTAMLNIPLFVLATMVEKTIEWMLATNKATNAVARAYAGNQRYSDSIRQQSLELGNLGIEAKKVQEAYMALSTSVSSRITSDEKSTKALTDQATKFDALGVSMDTFMKISSSLNTRGLNVEQINDMTNELMRMGDAIGVTTKDMMDGFQQASATLAVYGPRMQTQIFGKLASMAKAAGVEVGSLLAVAGKFDTFDSAAKTVAGLNAVLGTQFSQTEMLMMTEEQRIETVMKEFKMKGIQFSQMDRFKQKLIAEQLGFKNVDEAAKVLNGTYDEYKKNQALAAEQAKGQKKVDDAMKASEDVRMKLKIWFHNFVSKNGPDFLKWIEDVVPKLVTFATTWGPLIVKTLAFVKVLKTLGFMYGVVVGGLKAIRLATIAASAATGGFSKVKAFLGALFFKDTMEKSKNTTVTIINAEAVTLHAGAELGSVGPKMASGNASRFSAKGMLMLGAALGAILAGVGLAAGGIGYLANSLKGLSDQDWERLKTMLMGLGIALVVFGALAVAAGFFMGAAAKPTLLFGVALLMIGGAIFLAATGIGIMAEGISKMILGIAEVGKTGLTGAVAIGALSLAMYALGPALFVGALGMIKFAVANAAATPILLGIAITMGILMALATIFITKVAKMAESFHQLAKIAATSSKEILKVMDAFGGLSTTMIKLGNPLALVGGYNLRKTLNAMTAYAAEVSTIAQAQGDVTGAFQGMMSATENIDMTTTNDQIRGVSKAMNAIDEELGVGDKRIEILTVLESLAVMSGEDLSNSVRQVHLNKLAVTAEVTKFDPKDYQVDDFHIRLDIDGYAFETYVEDVVAKYNKKT